MRVALFKGKSLTSKVIRNFTRSKYSHVAMVLDDDTCYEAWKGGITKSPSISTKHTKGTEVELFEVVTTPEQDAIIITFLEKQVGKKYDFMGVMGFVTLSSGNKEKWFCSELVFAAFQAAGINLLERIKAYKVSPAILSYSHFLKFIKTVFT